jgi:hypothetical protein
MDILKPPLIPTVEFRYRACLPPTGVAKDLATITDREKCLLHHNRDVPGLV